MPSIGSSRRNTVSTSMTTSLTKILIPIDVSKPVSTDGTIVETLSDTNIVLLGYWPIPDQTGSDQAREQFGTDAEERLQTVANQLTDRGIDVQTRLVFTQNRNQMIDEAVNLYDCQSVLVPRSDTASEPVERGIVLVKPNADLDRIAVTVGELFAESDVDLLLFHVVERENKRLHDATEYMLRGLAARLSELGINQDKIEWEQSTDKPHHDVILERVSDFDFVVLSETNPTIRERVFGNLQSKLADKTDKSLLTIRTQN